MDFNCRKYFVNKEKNNKQSFDCSIQSYDILNIILNIQIMIILGTIPFSNFEHSFYRPISSSNADMDC